MSTYRPPEKSLLQKLSENLFVQLGLVLFIGIIAVLMVTKNQKESFWSRVEFLRGSSTQISQSREANQFTSLDSEEQVAQQVLEEASADPKAPVTRKTAPQAKIYYLEIPQAVLSKWLEDGILTRVETSGEITIGYIPQLATALEQYKTQIKVLKQDSFQYNLNQLYTAKLENPAPTTVPITPQANNASRAVANTAPGQDLPAFTAYATLDDDRNENLSGQFEISVNPQSSFPAHFEMPPDQSFFISGFARTRSLPERSATAETVVVFKIDR